MPRGGVEKGVATWKILSGKIKGGTKVKIGRSLPPPGKISR
jgi:hypothetical protein